MSSAILSPCRNYRHLLTRSAEVNQPEKATALFVMLNPSTADAESDDRTIRRCRGFAKTWDCNGLAVANLYALRSTYPKQLWNSDDPVGPENDAWLLRLAREYDDIVCAWCVNAKADRVEAFRELAATAGARLWCLGTTKSEAPRHRSMSARIRNWCDGRRSRPNCCVGRVRRSEARRTGLARTVRGRRLFRAVPAQGPATQVLQHRMPA